MSHTPGPWMHLSGGHVTTTAGPDWPSHVVADCGREEDAHAVAALPECLAALEELRKQLRAHVKFDVRRHYSLMVADAAAGTAIARART